ncbi:MAG: hypothetical protein HC905_31740 [Bacteroidales bacterium]|nr:hypothetical protein [Bacteroidales bacterium]
MLIFILALATLIAIIAINPFHMMLTGIMVVANIAILIFPHWFTGIKRITTLPALINKIKIFLSVSDEFGSRLKNENISYLML